ncbi:HD-GYP domain-containing protein [Pseudorhodoferax sp. Leaf274]|uniref:HD-GYP domain-containing protein n=1 Tax=Pseudorhodoferax sp. Leaf274 TaxID=1736318 RepID=UPI0007032984|nr:HD-GYP domain-containing protein [Pseudorhodoferax sp. Leaf274]KQP40024.1 phosphodiesterase [Pseudorhodoferax sp. Leaf274]
MLKRVPVADLTLGMFLHRFDGAWMDHPFWRQNFLLESAEELGRIRASGVQAAWIDLARSVLPDAALAPPPPTPAAAPEPAAATPQRPAPTRMEDELRTAVKLCGQARECITTVFEEARMGRLTDSSAARGLVEDVCDSVLRNPGALISLARLKTADSYTYMHSVAVCALMVSLAAQLGLDTQQTRDAGLAGLLHDIGKARVPLAVLNKPGKLTDDEFAVVRSHSEHGHAMLLECGDVGDAVLDACLHHHEKMDGTGYPERLQGAGISRIARMTAICDVYDAVTSDRPYKKAWDPAEAVRRMAEWSGGHFDKSLFQAFVKSVGIYPVGSLVKLSSGRLAVVVEQSPALTTPKVKVFFSTKAQLRLVPEILDLSRTVNEKIVSREDSQQWHFNDLNELWAGFPVQPW